MPRGDDPAELVGLRPDPRLLSEALTAVPDTSGRPVEIPPSSLRPALVGIGAGLTGLTLVGGIGLILLGLVLLVSDGIGLGAALAVLVGIVAVSTHWGWVHVAELTSVSLERRGHRELVAGREHWLATIEPYVHYVVRTTVHDDGAIEIVTTRH